jgi:hypothetical protein
MIPLEPLTHESVFSWVVRYHFKLGVGHERNTYWTLFKHDKVRIHPYLPNSLHCLPHHGRLTTEDWLEQHTLYPLFRFFGHDANNRLKLAMLSPSRNTVSSANIPQSRLCFEFGHKYCPVCFKEHVAKTGIPFYDIRYQIPGLSVCPIHRCELTLVKCGDVGIDRRLTFSKLDTVTAASNPFVIEFCQFCLDALTIIKPLPCSIARLNDQYWHQLAKRQLVTQCQHLKMSALVSSLKTFYRDFEFTSGLESLVSFHFLGPLLRLKTHTLCHPIKHLLLAFWLFDKDASLFQSEESKPYKPSLGDMPVPRSHMDTSIIELLDQGKSMNQIEAETGKSRCYIRRTAELNGMPHNSNQQAFSKNTRRLILVQALLGRHRHEIARSVGVGVGYVEQIISNTAGLVQWRKKLKIVEKISKAAKELKNAKAIHPNWIRKDFKHNHNQAFFYLYNHSRILLETILPGKQAPYRASIDWRKEDDRLYLAISALNTIDNLSISAIGEKVVDHGHLRKKLNKLPKTKSLLIHAGKLTRTGISKKT